MAIGWDEDWNRTGENIRAMKAAAKAKLAEQEREMEKMKYQSRYVFTGEELKLMEKYVKDDEGNNVLQEEHFDSEDFEI